VNRPSAAVVLCALPRSGSSLLAELLYGTGVVGYPGEWFWSRERERLWREWGVDSHAAYLGRVLARGTAPNGVFAAKVMWGQLDEFLLYARRVCADSSSDDLAVIEALLPQPSFVWVRRHDTVAQGVSWVKANQTGQWRSGLGEGAEAFTTSARSTGACIRFASGTAPGSDGLTPKESIPQSSGTRTSR
jgi:LPS sulfotransferase NodH